MDKADLSRHIPPEALEAAAKRICAVRFGDWFWAMAHESQREDMRSEARAAIAAMLAAWPGMIWHPQGTYRKRFGVTHLILPLPTEAGE